MRIVAALLAVLALSACGGSSQSARPELQRTLDQLVRFKLAPGATAYVAGPHGTWTGAAGYANVATEERLRPDARMRLESVSKLWTATIVAKLAAEHRLALDDTVEHWLPGVFPYGRKVTLRQLLQHTSGLIDNNDLSQRPAYWLGRIHDRALRGELLTLVASLRRDPAYVYSDAIEIRAAAALPLLFEPGTSWHYSNIGYKVAARIAERASGEPLDTLYHRIIIDRLRLRSAAYDPNGAIEGEHPIGYAMVGRQAVEATDSGAGALGAEGGIVANAHDEAAFLVAIVRGRLVATNDLLAPAAANGTYALGTGLATACGRTAYTHGGAGAGWKSQVAVSKDGSRVAVLLMNGRRAGAAAEQDYAAAVLRLFCAA